MKALQNVWSNHRLAWIPNQTVSELLFASNIAGALLFSGLVYVCRNALSPHDDSTYLAHRNMYRLVDFLGLVSRNPVLTQTLRRQFPAPSEQWGAEVFVLVTWLGVTAAAVLALLLFRRTNLYQVILGRAAPIILLFAAPVCYLWIAWLTRKWPHPPVFGRPGSFFTGAPFALFVSEAVCLGASLRLFRQRQVPVWIKVPALAVHFWLWIALLWSEPVIWFSPLHARILILAVLPVSALIFTLRKEQVAFRGGTRPPGWAWGIATLTLVGVGSLWIPAWGGRLSRMKNLGAMTLELSRGPCYGPCPLYRITLRGDGRVQFVGKRPYSRVETTESGMIDKDKVALILRTLDGVDFMTLDGRAFAWAFDTPSVAVQVSTDERTKLVVSDAGFVGAATGRQARFVEAARKIDAILMSAKWDTCEGDCGISNALQ